MHGPNSMWEGYHWAATAASPVVLATIAQRYMPNPNKFVEIWVLEKCPVWYLRIFNITRYVASLSMGAGWKDQIIVPVKTEVAAQVTKTETVGERREDPAPAKKEGE